MNVFLILFSFLTNTAFAISLINSRVIKIDLGSKILDEPLIFIASGQVLRLSESKLTLLKELENARGRNTDITLLLDDNRKIIQVNSIEKMTSGNTADLLFQFDQSPDSSFFNPSILKSLDQARFFFNEARLNPKESQCYNRAHAWAYDWRINRNLYSTKIWIYFTPKYIREYKFDWWFHVSPVVHVVVNGQVKERVMDIKYSKGPLKIKQWSDIFMRNSVDCPVVEKYSDQANYPESAYCYLMKSSMYFYQPVDLEMFERDLIEKSRWVESEVKNAFLDALEISL